MGMTAGASLAWPHPRTKGVAMPDNAGALSSLISNVYVQCGIPQQMCQEIATSHHDSLRLRGYSIRHTLIAIIVLCLGDSKALPVLSRPHLLVPL